MAYILIPILVILFIAVVCLNLKLGFLVSDWTEGTGFNFGFYMMTVFGLFAAEISLGAFIINVMRG